jgi:hypothetical protein
MEDIVEKRSLLRRREGFRDRIEYGEALVSLVLRRQSGDAIQQIVKSFLNWVGVYS